MQLFSLLSLQVAGSRYTLRTIECNVFVPYYVAFLLLEGSVSFFGCQGFNLLLLCVDVYKMTVPKLPVPPKRLSVNFCTNNSKERRLLSQAKPSFFAGLMGLHLSRQLA